MFICERRAGTYNSLIWFQMLGMYVYVHTFTYADTRVAEFNYYEIHTLLSGFRVLYKRPFIISLQTVHMIRHHVFLNDK